MNLAKSIKVGLAKNDLNQTHLQALFCVSEVTTSRWVNGKAEPSLRIVRGMAELFQVKTSEFISWGE